MLSINQLAGFSNIIQLGGSYTVTANSVSGSTNPGGSGSGTITYPTGIQANDLLVVLVHIGGVNSSLSLTGFTNINTHVLWKRATGTENGTSLAWSLGGSDTALGRFFRGGMFKVRNSNGQLCSLKGSPSSVYSSGSISLALPSDGGLGNGFDLVLAEASRGDNDIGITVSPPANWTQLVTATRDNSWFALNPQAPFTFTMNRDGVQVHLVRVNF